MGVSEIIAEGGAPGFATTQVTVASTLGGTLLTNAANKNRRCVTIVNIGGAATYIGVSGVTTATGQYLAGVVGQTLTFFTTQQLYAIVGSSTNVVGVSEEFD